MMPIGNRTDARLAAIAGALAMMGRNPYGTSTVRAEERRRRTRIPAKFMGSKKKTRLARRRQQER